MFRSIILGLIVLLLVVSNVPAQTILINNDGGKIEAVILKDDIKAGTEKDFQLTDDVTYAMVWIPAGTFEMMGSTEDELIRQDNEGPVHEVIFKKGFWMGKYEISQAQWKAVIGNNPAHEHGVGDNYPVCYVSWDDIQQFESMLDNKFRLPSESEWEYACRAGTNTRFYWGNDPDYDNIDVYAWYGNNSNDQTHEVGQKLPNAWNLYDMSGNVLEWCEDWYHENYDKAPSDGRAWLTPSSTARIIRGGGAPFFPAFARSAFRASAKSSYSSAPIGFRLVRDAE